MSKEEKLVLWVELNCSMMGNLVSVNQMLEMLRMVTSMENPMEGPRGGLENILSYVKKNNSSQRERKKETLLFKVEARSSCCFFVIFSLLLLMVVVIADQKNQTEHEVHIQYTHDHRE